MKKVADWIHRAFLFAIAVFDRCSWFAIDVLDGCCAAFRWAFKLAVLLGVLYVGYLGMGYGLGEEPLPVEIASNFDVGEAAHIHQPGDNVIDGRVFVRLWWGEEMSCAGNTVLLVPGTALSRERMGHLYGTTVTPALRKHVKDRVKLEAPDAQYWEYMREAACDGEGNFRFAGVADGGYFVVGSVFWKGRQGWEGGSLMLRIDVRGGETLDLLLTPRGRL